MNYEIVAFIVYFLVVLAIGIIFFIKGKGTGKRNISWEEEAWDRG